ncbi:MAG TPA: hypothetical protein VF720_09135 [Candidatus Eisenbacteria bacterium]
MFPLSTPSALRPLFAMMSLALVALTAGFDLAEFRICLEKDGRVHAELSSSACGLDDGGCPDSGNEPADLPGGECDEDCLDISGTVPALRHEAVTTMALTPGLTVLPPSHPDLLPTTLVAVEAPHRFVADHLNGSTFSFRETIVLTS